MSHSPTWFLPWDIESFPYQCSRYSLYKYSYADFSDLGDDGPRPATSDEYTGNDGFALKVWVLEWL